MLNNYLKYYKNNRCLMCGKKIYRYATKCSKCWYKFAKGENHPAWKRGKRKCKDCGKELKRWNAKRCKSCENSRRFKNPKNHPNYGKKFLKHSIRMTGKRNPNYQKVSINGNTLIKHHIDLNKRNNKENNILLIKQGLHTSLHQRAYLYLVKKKQIKGYIKWFFKYHLKKRE